MIDAETKLQIANRFSIPPPLVFALDGKHPSAGLLASFGLTDKRADEDPVATLTVVAHALAQEFATHKDLNSALSVVFGGSPDAHQSPTGSIGGKVIGIIAEAANKLSSGWEGFSPNSSQAFGAMARDIGSFLQSSRDLGVVSDDALKFWSQTVGRVAPQPVAAPTSMNAATGADPNTPAPKGPTAAEVESFAGQMKSLGIDVDHFLQNFATYSALNYKLLSKKTSLDDYANVNGMHPAQILEHVRVQPHPVYGHLSAGEYADAHDMAWLHSVNYQKRTPAPAEVARFAAAKANWAQVQQHYAGQGPKHA